MSRIGRKTLVIPKGVEFEAAGSELVVKGPKGKLQLKIQPGIGLEQTGQEVNVVVNEPKRKNIRAFYGMTRALIQNMLIGVSTGFKKDLLIKGVGYRAAVKGDILTLSVGYSHPVDIVIPEDVEVSVQANVNISVSGIDKQKVGYFADLIRGQRKPEPYKGKGISYVGERIKLKAGKTAGK